MRSAGTYGLALATSSLFYHNFASAQTSSKCNPLHQTCPPDPALGRSTEIDFTSGQSDQFTSSGNGISYDGQGLHLTVAKSGDAPTLTSNWYLMFGKVEIEMQAAPGTGIVSSLVLESDDLDEIDWELLGSDPDRVQTNYFGKGQTGSYDRGAFSADPGSHTSSHTYTIDWTANQIVWQIDGSTVRALSPQNANGQYPQTPMHLKLGAWAGGDSTNAPGVISWAGGHTDYSQGPFTMYVKSVRAQDYSTGTQYTYSGSSGTWQSIHAAGGSVNSGGSGSSSMDTSAPVITSTTSGQPMPFDGTHAQPSSSYTATSIPGLPVGWSVSSSGKVVPPSSAPVSTRMPLSLCFECYSKNSVTDSSSLQSPYPAGSTASSPQASSSASGSSGGSSDGKVAVTSPAITSSPAAATGSISPYGGAPGAGGAANSVHTPVFPSMASSYMRNSTASNSIAPGQSVYTGAAVALNGAGGVARLAAAGAFGYLAFML